MCGCNMQIFPARSTRGIIEAALSVELLGMHVIQLHNAEIDSLVILNFY